MYDPIRRSEEVSSMVSRNGERKYHRFRPARFYGGIATADCVGCNLRCLFCWSWREAVRPEAFGEFYSAESAAKRLMAIARKKGFKQVRISGNEPTLSREHLMRVIEQIPMDLLFILETNGILIGNDETYAKDLARFKNLYVRVSVKGTTEQEFSRLTGAEPVGFVLQLKALENLYGAGVQAHPAVMASFSPLENVKSLQRRLGEISSGYRDIEMEEVILYGDVEERLREAKLEYGVAYAPEKIPSDRI